MLALSVLSRQAHRKTHDPPTPCVMLVVIAWPGLKLSRGDLMSLATAHEEVSVLFADIQGVLGSAVHEMAQRLQVTRKQHSNDDALSQGTVAYNPHLLLLRP